MPPVYDAPSPAVAFAPRINAESFSSMSLDNKDESQSSLNTSSTPSTTLGLTPLGCLTGLTATFLVAIWPGLWDYMNEEMSVQAL